MGDVMDPSVGPVFCAFLQPEGEDGELQVGTGLGFAQLLITHSSFFITHHSSLITHHSSLIPLLLLIALT
jgi:hypothetical protein